MWTGPSSICMSHLVEKYKRCCLYMLIYLQSWDSFRNAVSYSGKFRMTLKSNSLDFQITLTGYYWMKIQSLKNLHVLSVYLQNGDGEDPAFCKINSSTFHNINSQVRSERTIGLIYYIQRYFFVKNAQYILKENVSSKSLKSASKTHIQCKRPNTIS